MHYREITLIYASVYFGKCIICCKDIILKPKTRKEYLTIKTLKSTYIEHENCWENNVNWFGKRMEIELIWKT